MTAGNAGRKKRNMKQNLATLIAFAAVGCAGIAGETAELGTTEQEIGLKPARKGCYLEPGIFRAADGSMQPFSAYVCWLPPDNNFVVIGAFGSLEIDLSLPDATTFPPANPAAPFLYEYSEDADCSPGLLTTDCIGNEEVFFSFVPGSTPAISQELVWSLTRAAGAPEASPFFAQPDYVFSSVAEAGEGVDAFNYRVTGSECVQAVDRMNAFFDARGVTFSVIELDAEELCD